jgi:hypothetical protein
MWLLAFVILPGVGVLAFCLLLSVVMLAREQRAAAAKCRLADFVTAHEAIPVNEERRERELSQLRAIWALS